MAPTLTLIRGLPGSGKSTLAKTMNAHHFEADMYFLNDEGEYHYDADNIARAHHWCQAQTKRCLAAGQDVVVANTFIRRWEMRVYQKMAQVYGARLEVIECDGEYQNIHGVDEHTIKEMRKRWQAWQSDPR